MIKLFTAIRLPAYRALGNARFLSQTSRILDKTPSTQPPQPAQSDAPAKSVTDAAPAPAQPWQKSTVYAKLTAFDRRVLVWSGRFKNASEIPENVPAKTLENARDRFRVKACIYMMLVCIVACIVQVIRGKNAAERGESVVNANLEWHRQYNESNPKKDK